jgi:vacuolar-type H+-ATPase subunit B/Vma2
MRASSAATEALAPGVDPDRFAAAAMAEIELREGYEGELRTALEHCMTRMGS